MADERDILIEMLKQALRKAIIFTHRTKRRCVEHDPAGSTYEIDWNDEAMAWAKLCDLDLTKFEPPD